MYSDWICLSLLFILLVLFAIIYYIDNIITLLMILEILLLIVITMFTTASIILDDVLGSIKGKLLIPLAGMESAVGLSVLVYYYGYYGNVNL